MWFWAVQRNALCRSGRELSNEYLLAKFGFDTAENEPYYFVSSSSREFEFELWNFEALICSSETARLHVRMQPAASVGSTRKSSGEREIVCQFLEGSFSAVSKPNFASKYAFESSRRDPHNALLCTALKPHFLPKFAKILANKLLFFSEILLNFAKICKSFGNFLEKNCD